MSWSLTTTISPRPTVRVAAIDAYGEILNSYRQHHRTDAQALELPWAVYLTGDDHRFRLLGFDLDAKTDAGQAHRDTDVLTGLLTDADIPYVVCASGPSDGRHIWVALQESVDAHTVATLARLLRHLCPSLDVAPLTNPATGCLRPPGAPHRAGGTSTVIRGDLNVLTNSTVTAAVVHRFAEQVARLVDDTEPAQAIDPHTPLPVDAHGRLYLPGRRRELPAVSAAALGELVADGDASAVLWRFLIGAAAARWRHADVAALVPTSPGLEHLRTGTTRTGRQPRPLRGPGGQAALLARQWDKAVRYVAGTDRQIGDDPTFDRRADAIAAHVRAIQGRADVSAGRWAQGGGPADRRILDVLCVLALQAVTADLEADIRRLALMAGVGRETARTALLRLSADGWITRSRGADGPHGAHWTIDPHQSIHNTTETTRSQADPRPAGAGSAERTTLLGTLTRRMTDAAHDLFTTGSALGHLAGNLYSRATNTLQTIDELARTTGASPQVIRRLLHRLVQAAVFERDLGGWRRTSGDSRRVAAERLAVEGRLLEREHRYLLERDVWAWWQAEEAWMRAPRRTHHSRRAGTEQLTLLPEVGTNVYGAYPRRGNGRADHRAARAVRAGREHATPITIATDEPWSAEAILTHVLGATRVA